MASSEEEEEKSPDPPLSTAEQRKQQPWTVLPDDDPLMQPPDHPPPSGNDEQAVDPSAFNRCPDEILSLILGCLTAADLAKAASACRRFRRTGSSPRLWRRLLLLDFHASTAFDFSHLPPPPPPGLPPVAVTVRSTLRPPPPPPPPMFGSTMSLSNGGLMYHDMYQAKASYVKRLKDVEKRKADRARERKRQEERDKLNRRRRRMGRFMELFSFRYILVVIGACFLALFGCLTTELNKPVDDRNFVGSPFIPVFVGVFYCGMGIFAGTVLYWKRFSQESSLGGLWDTHMGFGSLWINEVTSHFGGRRRVLTIFGGYALYFFVVVFVILLAIAAAGLVSWTVSFIPLWITIVLFALLISPPLGASTSNDKTEFVMSLLILLIPWLIFVILLPLFLDKYLAASLQQVMIPLWFQDGLYFVAIASHGISHFKSSKDWKELGAMLLFYLFFAPIVVFQALLCVFAANSDSLSPAALFSPMFLWFSVFMFVALGLLCSPDDSSSSAAANNLNNHFEDELFRAGGEHHRVAQHIQRRAREHRRELEMTRGYGSRTLDQAELMRQSWAHATNPQFDHVTPAMSELYEAGGDIADDQLSDFHRMQLAISRALADMNQEDARAIVHSAASAVQHAAALSQQQQQQMRHTEEISEIPPPPPDGDDIEIDQIPPPPPMPPPLPPRPQTPRLPPTVFEDEERSSSEEERRLDLA